MQNKPIRAKRRTTEQIHLELSAVVLILGRETETRQRAELVADAMKLLAELLVSPAPEPEYHTVLDHRGDPFSAGAPIPYRRGSALYRAMAIFRDHSLPITRTRFVERGGNPRDLDRLIEAGHVVLFQQSA